MAVVRTRREPACIFKRRAAARRTPPPLDRTQTLRAMHDEVKRFIDAYRDSFNQGPAAIAKFYSEPCVTARMGVVRVNRTLKDIQLLFAEIDERYRAKGFTHADVLSLDIRPLGSNSILATVQWAYKDARENTLWETTFSYNLYRRDGVWKILVLTMHDA